jgi:hypothetical protein
MGVHSPLYGARPQLFTLSEQYFSSAAAAGYIPLLGHWAGTDGYSPEQDIRLRFLNVHARTTVNDRVGSADDFILSVYKNGNAASAATPVLQVSRTLDDAVTTWHGTDESWDIITPSDYVCADLYWTNPGGNNGKIDRLNYRLLAEPARAAHMGSSRPLYHDTVHNGALIGMGGASSIRPYAQRYFVGNTSHGDDIPPGRTLVISSMFVTAELATVGLFRGSCSGLGLSATGWRYSRRRRT